MDCYPKHVISSSFKKLVSQAKNGSLVSNSKIKPSTRELFLKVPYDSGGPSRQSIRALLNIDLINQLLAQEKIGSIKICFLRNKNLRSQLCKDAKDEEPQEF